MLGPNADMASGLPVIEPRHKDVAVALRYERERDPAPVVTATARGALATRMVEMAKAHGVEIREDADLAQVLAKLDVGQTIPPLAFAAVAEILACLYRRNAELAAEHDGATGT
jgi:flagellar biosynthesis protein